MTSTPPTGTTDQGEARPDFTTFQPAARMVVEMTYDAHVAYETAHAATYGERSQGVKAWRDSIEPADLSTFVDSDTLANVDELARLTEDPSEAVALVAWLADMLAAAKANLSTLYFASKGVDPSQTEGVDVVELRAQLDALLTSCLALASTPVLDADAFWSLLPHKRTEAYVSKGGRKYAASTTYAGPSIPQTRRPAVRANSKFTLHAGPTEDSVIEHKGNLGTMVKAVLRLTMEEFREAFGDFSLAFSTDVRQIDTPNGAMFVRLVKD